MFALVYLDLALVDLSGVGGGLPRPAEVVQVKSRFGEVHLRYCAIYYRVMIWRKAILAEYIFEDILTFEIF